MHSRSAALVLTVFLGACGGDGSAGGGDAGPDGGPCPVSCAAGEVCRFGICIPTPLPCTMDEQCIGDTYCDESALECYPWGIGPGGSSDPACSRVVVPGVFFPGVQCEWLGPPAGDPFPDHRNILGTPMVVDFGGGGDPELSRPSIVFISYNFTDGGGLSCIGTDPAYFGVIRVIDGRTCEQRASLASPTVIASSSVALGDLTGDGLAEIVAPRIGGGLAAWTSDLLGGFTLLWQTASTFGAGACDWTGPSIHDLDDDARPEIIFYGAVFDADGNSVDESLGLLGAQNTTGYVPVVADVDADGFPELVHGAAIYGWDLIMRRWVLRSTLGAAAQTAVADLGTFLPDPALDDRATRDGIAEVVAVAANVITVYAIGGRVLYTSNIVGTGQGGPPTISDFDGDGRAEMATAGGTAYTVFDLDCDGTPDPSLCASGASTGILWSRPSQDGSSNTTGSSVFDFEGDGRAEAVYGDECFTRVYDGTTGTVMYSRYRTSCTWYENPVIADTDADYNAEIIITSNTNCGVGCPALDPIFDGVACDDESDCPAATACVREQPLDPLGRCRCTMDADCGGDGFVCRDPIAGPSPMGQVCRASHPGPSTAYGLRVIADGLDRWVGTRRIWNQHAYAVTNVDDGGRIPRTSQWERNWDLPGLNNFRQNAPGEGLGGGLARTPDLTVSSVETTCVMGLTGFDIEVCNRGSEPVADGLAVTVYAGMPPAAPVACGAVTDEDIQPGYCAFVECKWGGGGGGPIDYVVLVDDAAGAGANTECREDNNALVVPGVTCP